MEKSESKRILQDMFSHMVNNAYIRQGKILIKFPGDIDAEDTYDEWMRALHDILARR